MVNDEPINKSFFRPRWHYLANLNGTNDFRDAERYQSTTLNKVKNFLKQYFFRVSAYFVLILR